MRKLCLFLFFLSFFKILNAQTELVPYTLEFRSPVGERLNVGRSFLYSNATTNSLRADKVLPSKDSPDYEYFEWYFIPVGKEEPGWYYVRNGNGKYLYNTTRGVIEVNSETAGELTKWKLTKTQSYVRDVEDQIFRFVQWNGTRYIHMIRGSNTFITTANNFANSGTNTTVLVRPSRNYPLYNNNLQLVTNSQQVTPASSISVNPPYFVESDTSRTIISENYLPINFKRLNSSGTRLMLDPSAEEDNTQNLYYLRLYNNDTIRTKLTINGEKEHEYYQIRVKIKASENEVPPGGIRLSDKEGNNLQHPLYVKASYEWYTYQFYVDLSDYDKDINMDFYSSLGDSNAFFDISEILVEEVDSIPDVTPFFRPGLFSENNEPILDYPYENPGFIYSIRKKFDSETTELFIPLKIFGNITDFNISIVEINSQRIEEIPISDFSLSNLGIALYYTDGFEENSEYIFAMRGTENEVVFEQNVSLKVIPDTVYWNPQANFDKSFSWNNDNNWSDKNGNKAFVPTKYTTVILPEGKDSYPVLYDYLDPSRSSFIELDYNVDLNSCANIYFMTGSELGNPYYLNYDSVKINWRLNTMKWYNLSPPLRNMYSGDYSFDYLNPLSEMQLHNITNPQTGFYSSDWTESFNTTNYSLYPGIGFSFRIGSLYYNEVTEVGANYDSRTSLSEMEMYFPKSNTSFRFYDEVTKLPTDKIEHINENGRDFNSRFVYEITEGDESIVPEEEELLQLNTNLSNGEGLVVIGNPFMSHFNFEEFYYRNHLLIKPEFKVLIDEQYFTFSGVDNERIGMIESWTATHLDITPYSIGPMQSFIVTTREEYSGESLSVDRNMSLVKGQYIREEEDQTIPLTVR